MPTLAEILAAKQAKTVTTDVHSINLPDLCNPDVGSLPSNSFDIRTFVKIILRFNPDRPYYDLNLRPVFLLADWLGPFTKAPKSQRRGGISPWLALYHVPQLANYLRQDVHDFYDLFFEEAMLLHFRKNEKFFD